MLAAAHSSDTSRLVPSQQACELFRYSQGKLLLTDLRTVLACAQQQVLAPMYRCCNAFCLISCTYHDECAHMQNQHTSNITSCCFCFCTWLKSSHPSATELVCLVGGTDALVGRSHECDYPAAIKDRPILTGAKNPFVSCEQMNAAVTATLQTGEGLYYIHADVLKALRPDVIVTQSLCNVCSVDLRLVEQVVQEMAAAPDTPGAQPAASPKIISLNPFNIEVSKDRVLSVTLWISNILILMSIYYMLTIQRPSGLYAGLHSMAASTAAASFCEAV